MFVKLLITTAATSILGVVLSLSALVVVTVIKTVAARRELEKKGLKVADGFSIWAGHTNSISFARGQMYIFDDLRRKFNNAKTIGFLYGCSKAVWTVDLDLIKEVVLDQLENDRIMLHLPMKETEFGSIMTANGEQWRRIRRAFAPALKSNKFKTPNVQREIEQTIDKLVEAVESKLEASEQNEIVLDIDDYAHRYSLDLSFNCFYKQNDLVDFTSEVDPTTDLFDESYASFMTNPAIRLCVVFPILKPVVGWALQFHPRGFLRKKMMELVKLQTKLYFEARKYLDEVRETGEKVLDEDNFTLPDGTKFSRNMTDNVTDRFYEGKLSKQEYFHSTWFLLSAAEKTATDAIAHTIYQLATHAEVQEKLRKSMLEEGAESEYLSWVFNESLRLLPPVAIGCSRLTSREYKCESGVIPMGTFLTTATYSIHRLKEYWGPDADEFKPERFANAKDFHPLQFIPFGAGARSCPGKDFVLHEMKKLLCALLMRYQFHCEPLEVRYDSPFAFMQIPDKHVHVRISRV